MGKLSDFSERDKSRIAEENITVLVNAVRNDDCEESFGILESYLSYYIKLFGQKYRIPGCDSNEIEQESLYALRYKAIEDFNPNRGKFKSFAILCIKRHLFSLIKGSTQQKRQALNTSLSLDEDRSDDGDNLSLASLISSNEPHILDQIVKQEIDDRREKRLMAKLSKLEMEVYRLYIQQFHYDEIVVKLRKVFPKRNINKKAVDNSLSRLKQKAKNLSKQHDFEEF